MDEHDETAAVNELLESNTQQSATKNCNHNCQIKYNIIKMPIPFGVGSLASYSNLEKVGEGTYGFVYKAKDRRDNKLVALKRLLTCKPSHGFPLQAIREIKFLKTFEHVNIIKLKDVASSKGVEHLGKIYVKVEA